jgi:hypothetical protein
MRVMGWIKNLGHDHNYSLLDKDEYIEYIIFKFQCLVCGHYKTKMATKKDGFELEV